MERFLVENMKDQRLIIEVYQKMYKAMILKDEAGLNEVLDDRFVLVHMTGLRQSKQEFIHDVVNGTLNYYSAIHKKMTVEVKGDTAIIIGQSYVTAAVFGGRLSQWRLQQKCQLKKADNIWEITESVASTY